MKEISREIVFDMPITKNCLKCGKEIVLYFNGGELDDTECCGLYYNLQHGEIYFVVQKRIGIGS